MQIAVSVKFSTVRVRSGMT